MITAIHLSQITAVRFGLLLVGAFSLIAMDILGLGFLGVFVSNMTSGGKTEGFSFSYEVIEFMGISNNTLLYILPAIFVAKFILSLLFFYFIFLTCATTEARLRDEFLRIFFNQGYKVWLEKSAEEYLNVVNVWLPQYARLVLVQIIKSVSDILMLFGLVIFLFSVQGYFFASLLLFFLASAIFYILIFSGLNKKYANDFREASNDLMQDCAVYLAGYKELQVTNKSSFFRKKVLTGSRKLSKAVTISSTLSNVPRYYFETIIILAAVLVTVLMNSDDGDIVEFIPEFSVFTFTGFKLISIISSLISTYMMLVFNKPVVERLINIVQTKNAVKRPQPTQSPAFNFRSYSGLDLTFSHSKSSFPLILNSNFCLNYGEKVLIQGVSGVGKSTLLEILLGFFRLDNGTLLINGAVSDNAPELIRSMSFYVPQRPFIFNGTVAENILFGVEPTVSNQEKLWQALKLVGAFDLLSSLPDKENTLLGPGGLELSGGQKQRIALARAIFSGKKLLILDEATSALDFEAEKMIMETLLKLSGHTILVVSHNEEKFAHLFDQKWLLKDNSIFLVGKG